MLPDKPVVLHGTNLSPAEHQQLIKERRAALHQAAVYAGVLDSEDVHARMGWKAHITLCRRAADGCLLAAITVTTPWEIKPYTRKVRLVPKERLPYQLG